RGILHLQRGLQLISVVRRQRRRCVVKRPRYDAVLLTGSDEELNEYIENSGKCLVVDWRAAEDNLTDELAKILRTKQLSHEWSEPEDDMYVVYRGVRHKIGLTFSWRDRYIWLRRMNEIMAGDFELRGFRHTLGDDTHCFLPARCDWWAAMEESFPKEVRR